MVFVSCKKDFSEENENRPETIEDLKVASDFDWKTTKDLRVAFTAGSSGIVELVSGHGIIYQQAYLQAEDTYIMMLAIPAYEDKLIARFNDQLQAIDSGKEMISIRF